jgi:hypothetical protein
VLLRAKRFTLLCRICLERDIWKHVSLAFVASFLYYLVQLQLILISFFEVYGPCQPVQIGTGLAGTTARAHASDINAAVHGMVVVPYAILHGGT